MSEQDGIKAIQYLQSLVGVEEPEEKARRGWKSLTRGEKERTLDIYRLLTKEISHGSI